MEAQSNKQCSFFDGTIRDTTTTTTKQGKQPTATSRKPGKQSAANQEQRLQDAMRSEAQKEISTMIHKLGKSGMNFDSDGLYAMDPRLAGDSEYIVQGRDPQAARSSERYATTRKIVAEKKHWVASRQGYYMTPYGKVAYVHTDGSVAMLSHGIENVCQCGAVHMA